MSGVGLCPDHGGPPSQPSVAAAPAEKPKRPAPRPALPPGNQTIAANLRTARQEAGLSQQKLARKAGVSPRRLSQAERGKRTLYPDEVLALRAALR